MGIQFRKYRILLEKEVRENKIGFVTVLKECKGISIWLGVLPMLFWDQVFDMLIIGASDLITTFIVRSF